MIRNASRAQVPKRIFFGRPRLYSEGDLDGRAGALTVIATVNRKYWPKLKSDLGSEARDINFEPY
jgi:hypothetical protein